MNWSVPVVRSARKIRVADLFCGCGGLTAGAQRAIAAFGGSMEVAFAIDSDATASAVYTENFESISSSIISAGVEEMFHVARGGGSLLRSERNLLRKYGRIDLIVAGPPCQGHSSLNNFSRGADPRNELYWAPIRAAMIFSPDVLLIENVPGVTTSQERVIERAIECLEKMKYSVSEATVRLSDLGVPQQRRRHVLVATRSSFSVSDFLDARHQSETVKVIDAIGDLEDTAGPTHPPLSRTTKLSNENKSRIDYLFDNDAYDLPDALRPPCHRDKAHSYQSMYGRMYPDRPAQTITGGFGSMGQGRFVHPTRRRMITAHEAARIQGFEDDFRFGAAPDITSLRRMIGNAAPPALAEVLLSELIERGLL